VADLGEQAFEVLGLATGEDDDATAVEGGLHDVLDASGQRRLVDVGLLVVIAPEQLDAEMARRRAT
jgi:hypothetical protein